MDLYKNKNLCTSKGRRHRLKKLKRLHRILRFDIFSRERPSTISEITRSCYRRWRMSRRGRKPAVLIIIVIMRSWLTIWVVSWTQIIIVANIKWTIEAVVRCSLRVTEITAIRIIYVTRGNSLKQGRPREGEKWERERKIYQPHQRRLKWYVRLTQGVIMKSLSQ